MYSLFDTKSVWPQASATPGQVLYSAVPGTPLMMNKQPLQQPPLYYQLQPAWVATPAPSNQRRIRMSSSDDVFLSDVAYVYDKPILHRANVPACDSDLSLKLRSRASKAPGYNVPDPFHSFESHSGSSETSPVSSLNANQTNRGHYTTPTKLGYFSDNSSNVSSDSNESSPSQQKDDSLIHNLFPASLCAALNEDPPEPKPSKVPLKTSSPIYDDEDCDVVFELGKLRKRRGRYITSSSSEKCPRFSENGISEELDQCDKILLQSRSHHHSLADEQSKRREEFLLILEAERERQRKLVLPKHTPKMNCKFCKNNGESPEVYTKHRLHYNEKTVCPLLRHYVCRLCNSTGDFAHTIRHCPFNDKKDKIAWRATFLV
ncbi:NANOS1 [Biomphalaria pfeifferi]|uniref:NANOS1 n=1 Tax=Biomphalaria pfeifferi TaxID=112525 RepID=A0AAD8AYY6_BIOPF|nr:NANOS1 [Biomphalaria pfeifferi]